ncbi:PilZ domain-containing protein [Leucothrix arctica]|uniref:Pilus assembly protein PilZ n=1 Tax=Leucothrix arctica TaxID=1481894 RepID=A0A317C6K4_9GAMM|nr:PilZ domain-containing protein [Leucothrix arctica]PWQ93919.1 pilus assembly protein PilZ [Leucothrix arctica]
MEQQDPTVRNVVSVTLKDKAALHANYMPFIRGGGLYAVADKPYKLGDQVILSLKIDSVGKRFAIPGDVVWMSPKDSSGKHGIGVRFGGRTKDNVRVFLESILGDLAKKPSVYHAY